jgi:hypothetical protein
MFEDSETEETNISPRFYTRNPRFYILDDKNYSAIVFNLEGKDTKQFKPGINLEYEIIIKLNTDSFATIGNKDSIIIEPQHPIAVVDSLYSAL